MRRETDSAYYRPTVRKLKDLTNEELQQLFELRASKVKMDPKGFWDDCRIVYWATMRKHLAALYEVMLEIQSRYPKGEICGHDGKWDYDDGSYPVEECLLPVHFKLQASVNIRTGFTEVQEQNSAPKPGRR